MVVKQVRPGEDAATNTRDACATLNRLLIVGQLVLSLNVISTLAAGAADASFKFAGVPFSPGSTVRANVPLSAEEKSYAGQGGNPVPQSAVAVLATPANFDPIKSWPVLQVPALNRKSVLPNCWKNLIENFPLRPMKRRSRTTPGRAARPMRWRC